jgi:hypothetical protein
MTLVHARSHYDTAVEYLALTATLLQACDTYFQTSDPTLARAMAVATEMEARAAVPGHPSPATAKLWRASPIFALARELRDGLAGVRLMVASATQAAENAATALTCCTTTPEETPQHQTAKESAKQTTRTIQTLKELTANLTELDTILKTLRADPWSTPDRLITEQLRRKVTTGDLTRAKRELTTTKTLLTKAKTTTKTTQNPTQNPPTPRPPT